MNEAVVELVVMILGTIATGAISIAVAFFQSKVKSQNLNDAMGRLGEAATVTVGELQQTMVNAWKEAGGGKLSPSQIESLKATLLTKTKQKLDQPAINLLQAAGADINALITGFAENAVRQIKNEEPMALSLPVAFGQESVD